MGQQVVLESRKKVRGKWLDIIVDKTRVQYLISKKDHWPLNKGPGLSFSVEVVP